jgi:Response regulators consisting of a CheY-like receiver domain and a winged-helix DNA-binding domain
MGGGGMRDTILIVDDEADIVSTLEDYFLYNDYNIMTAANGREAIEKAGKQPDLILLDINMPDVDGLEVCARIRDFVSCPILFLTARVEDSDKVKGFGMGGDDYIVKPFSLDELGARVAAHLRRERRRGETPKVRFDDKLAIDYTERRLYYDSEEILLAKKEYDIIELLSGHPGQIFSKERIYELVWGYDREGDSSVVAEHIRRIRKKFVAVGAKSYVETVWGVGYKWAK